VGRLLVHAGAFNHGLWMRTMFGVGTPRGLQGHVAVLMAVLSALSTFVYEAIAPIWQLTDRSTLLMPRLNGFVACV